MDTVSNSAAADHHDTLTQEEVDQLLRLSGFLDQPDQADRHSLLDEIKDAVLDSGKLSLEEWVRLRHQLKELERLIPHIDLIIQLKQARKRG